MSNNLSTRYRDGYRVTEFLIKLGQVYKIVGAVLGVLLIIVGLFIGTYGSGLGIISIPVGVFIYFIFFINGVLVSASGQIFRAILDIAVHTSPLMDNDQKAAALGFARIVFSGSNNTTNDESTFDDTWKYPSNKPHQENNTTNDESTFDDTAISCPYCQTKMQAGTRFCTGCGERMP